MDRQDTYLVHKYNGRSFDVTTIPGDSLYKCELTDEKTDTFKVYGKYHYKYATERTYDITFSVGVKAAVGDFNGDGRDDIAVMRVMISYKEHLVVNNKPSKRDDTSWRTKVFWLDIEDMSYGASIDLYTFDTGSTMPNYLPRAGHIYTLFPDFPTYKDQKSTTPDPDSWMVRVNDNYVDLGNKSWTRGRIGTFVHYHNPNGVNPYYVGGNETSDGSTYDIPYRDRIQKFFLNPITGENTYYHAIDREFDIIAGKFSGTFGNVVPMDELIIKYPEYVGGSGNHLRTHFELLSWFSDVDKKPENTDVFRFHDIAQIDDRITYTALIKADFLNESLHVDNLTYTSGAMGADLTMEPHNFNLRTRSAISYTNTTASSEKKSVAYSMTSKAVRGITTTLFGKSPVGKAIEGIGQAWDALCDHMETTKTNSNENEVTHMLTTTNMADYLDELYFTAEWHHIWRYPVSMIPDFADKGNVDTSLSFDQSKVLDKQTYITFAMSEPGNLQPTLAVNDNLYQPYHEEGNLFSYPPSLAMVEGYGGNKPLYGARTWAGGNFDEHPTFAQTETTQEEIHVTLPTAYSNGAGFTADFQPYIDEGTAMKIRGVRFIVSDYNQYSNNLLVKGLKYKIRVPVFNASFVDTPADKPLKVRMSLAKTND